jgi:hypothetical protein
LFRTAALMALFGNIAAAQDQTEGVRGPILGFLGDSVNEAILPILGIPGASLLGQPLAVDRPVRTLAVSPRQDYALALLGESRDFVIVHLESNPIKITSVDGINSGVDVIAISPTGTAAGLYDHDSRIFTSIVELNAVPRSLFEFDASGMRGKLAGIAVADDGTFAMLNFAEGDSTELWIISSTAAPVLAPGLRPSAVAFVPQRHDVVIGDSATHEIFLLTGSPPVSRVSLASLGDGFDSISAVAASGDGRRVFVTSTNSQDIILIDVESRLTKAVSCRCRATGLHRLKGPSVFRLSDPSDGPIAVLDDSWAEPRVVIMPLENR